MVPASNIIRPPFTAIIAIPMGSMIRGSRVFL